MPTQHGSENAGLVPAILGYVIAHPAGASSFAFAVADVGLSLRARKHRALAQVEISTDLLPVLKRLARVDGLRGLPLLALAVSLAVPLHLGIRDVLGSALRLNTWCILGWCWSRRIRDTP